MSEIWNNHRIDSGAIFENQTSPRYHREAENLPEGQQTSANGIQGEIGIAQTTSEMRQAARDIYSNSSNNTTIYYPCIECWRQVNRYKGKICNSCIITLIHDKSIIVDRDSNTIPDKIE